MKLYIVSGDKQQDCTIFDFVLFTYANNAKEACTIAKDIWHTKTKRHLFHLHATKSRIQDIEQNAIRLWNNEEVKGENLLNTFHCVNYRVWRVNGRNLYGV